MLDVMSQIGKEMNYFTPLSLISFIFLMELVIPTLDALGS